MAHLLAQNPRLLRSIQLTKAERAIVATIKLDAHDLDDYDDTQRNGDAVCRLWESLASRDGLPDHRLSYFTDPAFKPSGRGKSWREIFERNGCRGEEILRHPHFLAHLSYMLHGADLPDQVIDQFSEAVDDCGIVTSSDCSHLTKKARDIARAYLPRPRESADDFYKLALDLGFAPSYALFYRSAVMSTR